MFRKAVFALTMLGVCSVAFAGVPAAAAKPDAASEARAVELQKSLAISTSIPSGTSTCTYTFTSNGSATVKYLQYCVTVNGNIVEFQSPKGAEFIRVGTFGEGYGICDISAGISYSDYADYGDSGNWKAPVLVSKNATDVKIARTTADGIWTLTQTITRVTPTATVKVAMALKNNTATSRDVNLVRWADVDANGTTFNNLDGTTDSAWGYSGSLGRGLMLTREKNAFTHNGWARNSSNPPDACNLDPGYVGTLTAVDGSIVLYHAFAVPKSGTSTVTVDYFEF
jgi:hypothetical protein